MLVTQNTLWTVTLEKCMPRYRTSCASTNPCFEAVCVAALSMRAACCLLHTLQGQKQWCAVSPPPPLSPSNAQHVRACGTQGIDLEQALLYSFAQPSIKP